MQLYAITEISMRRRRLAGWTVADDNMAGKICAACGCNNYQHDGKGLAFFRFPRDKER